MANRIPVVTISGQISQLPPGDSVSGASFGSFVAGSGLAGSATFGSNLTPSISLSPNPSGLFVSSDSLANNGSDLVAASSALASGVAANLVSTVALSSGNAAFPIANSALASGNAALFAIANAPGGAFESYTAASTVISGSPVGIDNSGRIQTIRTDPTDFPTFATQGTLLAGSPGQIFGSPATAYDSTNNQTVLVYYNGSGYPTAVAYTVSGTTATAGTPVVMESFSTSGGSPTIVAINSTQFVVTYARTSGALLRAAVLTSSTGRAISFGTVSSAATDFVYYSGYNTNAIGYDTNTSRVVIAYTRTTTNDLMGVVGSISGTTLTWGTPSVLEVAANYSLNNVYGNFVYFSAQSKLIFVYKNNSDYGVVKYLTISGLTFTASTASTYHSSTTYFISTKYSTVANKCAIFFERYSNGVSAVVLDFDGTTFSAGSRTTSPPLFQASYYYYIDSAYYSSSDRFIVTAGYSNSGAVVCKIVGTSILFGPFRGYADYSAVSAANTIVSLASNVGSFVILRYYNNTFYYIVVTSLSSNLLYPTRNGYPNYIGIAQTTVASGASVSVRLPGSVDKNQTGLTAGSFYYVNPTSSGVTTASGQPATWSGSYPESWQPIGKAINSSSLVLTGIL
jgi:hypothetical protein